MPRLCGDRIGRTRPLAVPCAEADVFEHPRAMGQPFERDKLIRFHHCDPAGIVFYPQYFVLFNELVEDWFNDGLQQDYAAMVYAQRLGTPMVRLETEFLSPSQIGETLTLSLAVHKIGRSSLELEVHGRSGGTARVRARLLVVLADVDRRRSVAIPEPLRERMRAYCVV